MYFPSGWLRVVPSKTIAEQGTFMVHTSYSQRDFRRTESEMRACESHEKRRSPESGFEVPARLVPFPSRSETINFTARAVDNKRGEI